MVCSMRLEFPITNESLERRRYSCTKNVTICVSNIVQLFTALSETLHNHLRHVAAEKTEITEEAQRIITTINKWT